MDFTASREVASFPVQIVDGPGKLDFISTFINPSSITPQMKRSLGDGNDAPFVPIDHTITFSRPFGTTEDVAMIIDAILSGFSHENNRNMTVRLVSSNSFDWHGEAAVYVYEGDYSFGSVTNTGEGMLRVYVPN